MARKRKAAYARKKQNKSNLFGLAIAVTVVLLMLIMVSVQSSQLRDKIAVKNAEIADVELQITAQEERTAELEEYAKEVKTKGFIEKKARELLGLVYPGEVVFKEDK